MSNNPYSIVQQATAALESKGYQGFATPTAAVASASMSMGDRARAAGTAIKDGVTWPFRKSWQILTGIPISAQRAVSTADVIPRAQDFARNAVTSAINAGTTDEAALQKIADRSLRQMMDAQRAARGHAAPALRNFGRSMVGRVTPETAAISREFVVANRAGLASRIVATPLNIMAKWRKTSLVAGGLLALGGAYKFFSGRENARAEAEYANNAQQVMAMQQQAAMMEAQAAQMRGGQAYGGYRNSVSPEEAAFMESQMRSGGLNGGHAAAEMQRRAAAATAPAMQSS